MNSNINESLIQQQNILDHVPVGLGFLIAIEIIPAESA